MYQLPLLFDEFTLEDVGHPGMDALKGLLVDTTVNDLFGQPVLSGQSPDMGVSNNLNR